MTASTVANGALVLAGLAWVGSAMLLPARDRWRRTAGIVIGSALVGALVWLMVFSAGAAYTIARGGGYVPMGEIATAAGALVASAACVAAVAAMRRGERA